MMRALEPEVVDAVWAAVEPLIPVPVDAHPLGCHRRRTSDRLCLWGLLIRLVTGCSWDTAEVLLARAVSDTTLRARRDEWVGAGVFERLADEAVAAYDRIVGLDLREVSIDASQHKAPGGGEGTGPNCTDKGRRGWKWSLAADGAGTPLGWVAAPANRIDAKLTAATLHAVDRLGVLGEIDTVHLDRGYDYGFVRADCAAAGISDVQIPHRRAPRRGRHKQPTPLGVRWTIERTNSWLTNFGQLRRNTDRYSAHRHAQLALAIALILTVKLIDWRDRWSPIR
jgi:transposase